jgi:hypothetical protein
MKYFEAFGESGYHSAFMTTYAFGALAFEDVPFPKLRGAGCRNIIVLADRQMVNQAFSEFGPPRFAGSSYHLIKADAPGAFHAKITMLVGPTKGRLMLGSANLTALGLGGNKELVANILYTPELPDHARYFASALAYIRRYVPGDDPWFSTGLQRAIRGAPWLRAATESTAPDDIVNDDLAVLVDRPDITLLDQIVARIGADPIKRLIVISPYWDTKLEGLARLQTALGVPATDLLIEKSSGSFPKGELHRFSGLELFDVEGSESDRFVHAKLIVAQGHSWDHVVSGSMNCTYPALMGLSKLSGNAEAGIYKRVPPGTAVEALSLEAYREAPLPVSSIAETILSTSNADDGRYVDGGTLIFQAGRLSWNPPSNLTSEAVMLTLFTRDGQGIDEGITLRTSVARSWYPSFKDIRPKYGRIIFADGLTSAPIQIVDLDVLAVATLPPQRGRKKQLFEVLAETLHEDLILIETLNQLEALEIDEDSASDEKPVQSKAPAPKAAAAPAYGVVPYEEFIRARSLAHMKEGFARNLLNGRQDSAATMLSACLNQLIGLVSRDLGADENQDIQAIDAVDFTTTEPQAPFDFDPSSKASDDKSRTRSKNAGDRATANKMQEAVAAFEGRCKSLRGKPIRTAEIVRLRALIQIILSHAQAVNGISFATQILPVYAKEGFDWPRLIGRLLLQHFGTSRAIQQLRVEPDEGEQQRVIEYMALANWAAQAALIAVKSHRDAAALRVPIERIVGALRTQTEAIVSVVPDDKKYFEQVSSKLDERFGARLGLR